MPTILTDDPTTFPAGVQVPAASEPRTSGSVQTGFQQLANRTAYTKTQLEKVLRSGDNGVRVIRRFATLAALQASTDHNDTELVLLDSVGVYQYSAASTATSNGVTVIAPTDVGGGSGRWIISFAALLNAANGIPQLDGSGKIPTASLELVDGSGRVPASSVRNGLVDFSQASTVSTQSTAVAQTAVTGALVTPTLAAGDIVEVCASLELHPNTDAYAMFEVTVPGGSPTLIGHAQGPMGNADGTPDTRMTMTALFNAMIPGLHTFQLYFGSADAGVVTVGRVQLWTKTFRP